MKSFEECLVFLAIDEQSREINVTKSWEGMDRLRWRVACHHFLLTVKEKGWDLLEWSLQFFYTSIFLFGGPEALNEAIVCLFRMANRHLQISMKAGTNLSFVIYIYKRIFSQRDVKCCAYKRDKKCSFNSVGKVGFDLAVSRGFRVSGRVKLGRAVFTKYDTCFG